ncbi:MAG: B12-binding domain-containing radical SAM protein [Methanomassiliicoccales archaeon]|nr:B12-binding domain-containing radical SAM protein [Methanomassiliicoccales archaeon]
MSRPRGYPVVLTADRTLMSEYRGGIFLGFSACIPSGIVPEWLYFGLFCPPIDVNADGSVPVAPCGTRKIESALLDAGFARDEVIVAHPEHLSKVIGPDTKILGITENDPLGIGPATSTFTQILSGEPYMRTKFREVLSHEAVRKHRPRIVVGGPGSWQLGDPEVRKNMGIDCVVMGEAEKVAPQLFRKIMAGETVPTQVMGEITPIEEISRLKGATVDGIVEIARGCGRGCEFCVPTLAKFRCLNIDQILADVDFNVAAGRQPLLHAEDVLRYGAKGIEVNPDKVLDLFRRVSQRPGVTTVGISHFALASALSAPQVIEEITRMLELTPRKWISGQTGIETASPALMTKFMVGKCRPFRPDQWADVVVQSFGLLEDNYWLPCGTIIMGLPGETEKDAAMTLELMDRLSGCKSLVVPLFFVATGDLEEGESFTLASMTHTHAELFLKCWEHDLHWAREIIPEWGDAAIRNHLVMPFLKLLLGFGISEVEELIEVCKEDYDYDVNAMLAAHRRNEFSMKPITARSFLNMIRERGRRNGVLKQKSPPEAEASAAR